MIEVFLGNDLGYLCESDCEAIKNKLEGRSFYSFMIDWSNNAGNCQLIIGTDYPDAKEEDVKSMFFNVLASEFADMAKKDKVYLIWEGDSHLSNDSLVLMGIFNSLQALEKGAEELVKNRLKDNFKYWEWRESECTEEEAVYNWLTENGSEKVAIAVCNYLPSDSIDEIYDGLVADEEIEEESDDDDDDEF